MDPRIDPMMPEAWKAADRPFTQAPLRGVVYTPRCVYDGGLADDSSSTPIRVALIDDYDVVLIGLAHMFDGYTDQSVIAEIDAHASLHDEVDIAMYDTFAQAEADCDDIDILIRNPRARRAVVYTWNSIPTWLQPPYRKERVAISPRPFRPVRLWMLCWPSTQGKPS